MNITDVRDLLNALAETPLPTILVIIGFLTLSIGFGLRMRIVFDVDRVDKRYAKTIGIVLLAAGLALYASTLLHGLPFGALGSAKRDPFLPYYLVMVPVIVALYWVSLALAVGPMQSRIVRGTFALVGVFATVAVVWRAVNVLFFVLASSGGSVPLDLRSGSGSPSRCCSAQTR